MYKRKLEKKLVKWKSRQVHKPLILRGARQVGKTSLVRYFGDANFEKVIEINLEKRTDRQIFEGVKSVEDLEKRLSLGMGEQMSAGRTLLFVDEIQELVEMMELLRFVSEERPNWHMIVAGSLLEVKLQGDWRVPVGRVEYEYLYPLTFFEYLEAVGKGRWVEELSSLQIGEELGMQELIKDEFERYVLLGGMPGVVAEFEREKEYGRVREVLMNIQLAYEEDVGKYLKSEEERKYLETVVREGAKLAGKTFRYEGFAGSSYRSREMSEAVDKVEKTMLCQQLPAINSTQLPMIPKMRRAKKMIWLDVGIVNMINEGYQELIKGEYGGRVMEQVVGQTLRAILPKTTRLAYYAKDRDMGSAEVDFCYQARGKLVAIEVKAGSNLGSKSLTGMRKEGGERVVPMTISWDKLGWNRDVLNIPFYLLERWEELSCSSRKLGRRGSVEGE